jgi:hypothetical protein
MPLDPDLTNAAAVDDCLVRLAAGDLTARDRIIELCAARLRVLASRLLDRFPKVRRWDDTDDVVRSARPRVHSAPENAATSLRDTSRKHCVYSGGTFSVKPHGFASVLTRAHRPR